MENVNSYKNITNLVKIIVSKIEDNKLNIETSILANYLACELLSCFMVTVHHHQIVIKRGNNIVVIKSTVTAGHL